jgi:hypothetical protein
LITTGKKKIQSSVGGKLAVFLLWREIFITTGKKKIHYDRKKKDTVVCLLGARFWRLRPEKKDTVICLTGCAVVLCFVVAGNFDYNRKKKIQSSVGGKLAVFLLWREIFITTGKKRYITTGKKKDTVVCLMGARFWRLRPEKKRYSRLSGGLCCCISFWFWREISIFFVVAGNFDYDRKKKRYSRLSGGCAIIITTGKKNTIVNIQFLLVQLELKLIQIR